MVGLVDLVYFGGGFVLGWSISFEIPKQHVQPHPRNFVPSLLFGILGMRAMGAVCLW